MVLDSPFSSLTKLMGELAQVYPLLPAGASIGPFFRNLAMRLLGLPVALWPERRGAAHRHSALGSTERLPLQSGRVAFTVPPFLVPPMISVLRSAVDQRANFDIERMELVRYSFGGVLAPRRVCIASLAGWAHPAHVCTGKDIGQRTPPDRPHSYRRTLPRAECRTPAFMFGWRMPAGVARAQDDFVDASHSRRLHANCASPCKCFVPFEVRAAAPACV
jgi:hypothetical protein